MPVTRRALVLLSALLVGCAGGGAGVQEVGCDSDADCDGGMRCFDQRVCIQTSLHDWDVVMRVAPGPTSGFIEEHFDVQVGGPMPQAMSWQLTSPARVRGTVRLAAKGAGLSELIPGTLIASAPGKLAATRLRYTASSLLTPQDGGDGAPGNDPPGESADPKWGFELRVQPGQTYDVAFWPQSKQLPPHYDRRTIGGDVDDLAIVLPTAPDVIAVTGRLIARPQPLACDPVEGPAEATTCVQDCKPLGLLRVSLLDEAGRQRSTSAQTDPDGRFSVKADASAGPLRLRFEPLPDSPKSSEQIDAQKLAASLPSGTFTRPIDTQQLRKAGLLSHDLGELNIGPLPGHHLLIRDVLGDDGLPLAGAQVVVERSMQSPSRCAPAAGGGFEEVPAITGFTLRRSAISDSAGRVKMRVLAGTGDIAVHPPPRISPSAVVQRNIPLAPTADEIRCPSRRKVKGRVEYRDKPIVGATVVIQPLPAVEGDIAGDPALAPVFVTSGDDGRYALFLDPGRYAMIIEPPPGSGLARTLSSVLEVKAPTKADASTVEHDLAAWPPTVLHGRLLGDNGAPQTGVLVEVLGKKMQLLEELNDGKPLALPLVHQTMLLLQTHQLGSAVTDSDGRFEILVAPGNLAP